MVLNNTTLSIPREKELGAYLYYVRDWPLFCWRGDEEFSSANNCFNIWSLCNHFFFPKSPAWKHFFSGFFFFSVIGYYKLINLCFRETIDSTIATYFLHICSGAEGVSSWVSESFRRDIGQFCSPRNESLANRRISSSLDFNLESFSYIKTYLLWKLWPISL